MLAEIWEEIRKAPSIAIFRHVHPDMDAIGSQMGLKKALEHLFPEKTIYAVGEETKDGFEMDAVSDQDLADALGILLDTANQERIDDKRYLDMNNTIRMDHHIKVEDLAKLDQVNEKACATAEVLADLFQKNGQDIGKEAAQLLYQALTADNARYTTGNTTPDSLRAGAWLLEQGADVVRSDMGNNGIHMDDFRYETKVREKSSLKGKFLFAVLSQADYLSCGLSMSRAKEKVFCMSRILDVEVWALFTEQETAGTYSASLRSRTIEVRDIAEQYGGGGHACACGIKDLTAMQVQELIVQLTERSKKQD